MLRVLQVSGPPEIKELMRQVKVDPHGIKIMLPKATSRVIRISALPAFAANILKQEMLSLGAEAAVSRNALTGKDRKTDCLLMGNLAQFNRLKEKLNRQPFGLNGLAKELSLALQGYSRENFLLRLGGHKINFTRSRIMGIINLTPDSFSGDGLYQKLRVPSYKLPVAEYAEKMVEDGADIIDVGGESSRPGAKPVPLKEEIARTIPAIKALAARIKIPVSVDTYKPEVARCALDSGAALVNDITGLRNMKMARLVARYKAGVVIMHMKGRPRTMQNSPVYKSLIDDILEFLRQAINRAAEAGIDREKIIVDPGIGFGKTAKQNLEILKRLAEFKVLGRPILAGTSRKSFLGKILNAPPRERIFGTVASCVLAVQNGAQIVRVHDVKAVKQALRILDHVRRQ